MVSLFTNLLTGPRRWLLLGLAIVLAIAFGSQGLDYASTWLAHHRAAKAVRGSERAAAARATAEPHLVHHFDSTFFSLAGQHREAVRAGRLNQQRYDSLRALFPAALPQLPAVPPRYRPSH